MTKPIAASSAAAINAGTRRSTVASHSATPASTKDSAVSFTIFGQEGTTLVSCSMSNAHPASTNKPTDSATKAANCAKYRVGSALSGLPMENQTTPMPTVPQLDGRILNRAPGLFQSSKFPGFASTYFPYPGNPRSASQHADPPRDAHAHHAPSGPRRFAG